MMNMILTYSERIEAALKAFVANPEPYLIGLDNPVDLRKLAAELNALPMALDFGGCYALRPNGEIFSFAWDEPYDLRIEDDPRICNLVLFQGAKKYPELNELVPSRPLDAIDCSFCNGTGVEPMNEKLGFTEERITYYCGGLGWLPK
jgi:hypothetical protein